MLDDTANKVVATALAQGAIANIHKAVRSKQRAQITVGGEGSDRKTDALKRRAGRTAEMLNRHVARHLDQRPATGNPIHSSSSRTRELTSNLRLGRVPRPDTTQIEA